MSIENQTIASDDDTADQPRIETIGAPVTAPDQVVEVRRRAGVAVALVGWWPGGAVAGAWTAVGAVVVISLFGAALQLSHWGLDISPFTHVPKLPGAAVTLRTTGTPLIVLSLAALALAAAGLAGLRRRDIG